MFPAFSRGAGLEADSEVGTWSKSCDSGQLTETVQTLDLLVQRGLFVCTALFCQILTTRVAKKSLAVGRGIHALLVKSGYESHTYFGNHIIRMYSSHGRLQLASQVFSRLVAPDAYSWSSIISAHAEHGHPIQAINLYWQLQKSEVVPDNHTFVAVLKACSAAAHLKSGRQVHADVLQSVVGPDLFVGNCLVDMYVKCGSLEEARRLFSNLVERDVVTWNAMLSGYAREELHEEALALYSGMLQTGIIPGEVTFVILLRACASVGALDHGRHLHMHTQQTGHENDVVIGNCLVDMYAKCGRLDDARQVFDTLAVKDVVTWNTMIAGYAHLGFALESLSLYANMQQKGIPSPNHVTFVCLLKACASIGASHEGKRIHSHIQERGLETDVIVSNCLVDMYAKCGSLADARSVFESMSSRNVVTWNAMLSGYAQHGLGEEALALYATMEQQVAITPVTFVSLLKACASIGALDQGKQLHAQVKERGLESDVVIGNCLVDLYAKCGSLDDARRLFDKLATRDERTWNAMLAGYAQHGLGKEALALYARMQLEGVTPAGDVTFVCLLKACATIGALDQGRQLHTSAQEAGLEPDVTVCNSVIDMYAKCGSLREARRVFDRMPAKDGATWNVMLAGYAQQGHGREALALYTSMSEEGIIPADRITLVCLLKACASIGALREGKILHSHAVELGLESDVAVGNCIVDMYAKCGILDEASKVFDNMVTKDTVTWNTILAAYAKHRLGQKALVLYSGMKQEGMACADNVTFLSLLKACASIASLDEGQQLHLQIQERGLESDTGVGSCLVDMYAKCGSLDAAHGAFMSLGTRDVVTWNAMIAAYAQHGLVHEALQCFDRMQLEGFDPDGVTFLSILAACSHAGLVDKGVEYFKAMNRDHGIRPELEHYVSMLDLFGRAGYFTQLEALLWSMPMQPNLATWLCVLGACRKHGNTALGERAFASAIQLQPKHAAAYKLMLHIYADAGLLDCAKRVERRMKEEGACKEPGLSWIEHGQQARFFMVGNCKHSQDQEVFDMLRKISSACRENLIHPEHQQENSSIL